MATIQLGNTKKINALINYCENKAEVSNGLECTKESARQQMKATRTLYDKDDGVQGHHVIQSFKPDEIDAQNANMAGLELAKKIAPNHEVMVYTHTDKEHIHNHIVINSVNYQDGSKYQSSKKDLFNIRALSDEICLEMDLSVVQEKSAEIRYTLSEKAIIEKGEISWKDELRQAIDLELKNSSNYQDFKDNLKTNYNIEVNDDRKHITYKHPDMQKVVRGNKLGLNYEKETIINGFERQIKREQEQDIDRKFSGVSRTRGDNSRERTKTREQSTQIGSDEIKSRIRSIEQRVESIGQREQRGNKKPGKTISSFDRGL